ncbi:hypothetical protein LCGC14_0624270 [marine sediment metagenome]|uniref:Uncharacterized protein n=1 Tax=marine sediment metagenome TaxID=412755 RepID=A0A0F9TQC4_9ZZZZ
MKAPQSDFEEIAKSKQFDGAGTETAIVIGGAPHVADMDLHPLAGITSIASNCFLRHPYFKPHYLMLSDRRPYIRENEAGRLARHAEDLRILLSITMFDPAVKCHGSPIQTRPPWRWFPWKVYGSVKAHNFDTFGKPLCSCATIGGPMVQAAAIMGAKRIGIVGIDMYAPKQGSMHFYKETHPYEGRSTATIQRDGTTMGPPKAMQRLADMKRELEARGVEVLNLSPNKGTPFAKAFGNYPYAKFVKGL